MMNIDGTSNNATGSNANSSLLQKFLNGDVDLRSIEQRDLRVRAFQFSFSRTSFFLLLASSK